MNIKDTWLENLRCFSGRKSQTSADDLRDSVVREVLDTKQVSKEHDGKVWFDWPKIRGAIFIIILLLPFLFIFAQLFNLQVVRGEINRKLSSENRLRRQIIRPPRGIIYDRSARPIVANKPGFSVVWNPPDFEGTSGTPRFWQEEDIDWQEVAGVLNLDYEQLKKKLQEAPLGRTVILQTGLSRDAATSLEIKFSSPYLNTEVYPLRDYLHGPAFAHVLGFTGEASVEDLSKGSVLLGSRIGKSGLEREFDYLLRGRSGARLLEVNVLGQTLAERDRKEAISGQDINTTLDIDLQKKAFSVIAESIESSEKATGGAIVAEDPQTGEILALVSYPSYDPDKFVSGLKEREYQELISDPREPLFNRALSGAYPPGSVFKPLVAVAALEEDIISPKDSINCKGSISVGSFIFRDWKLSGHGNVSLVDALGKSCDVYFYTIGGGYGGQGGLGPESISKWAINFGLGQVLGVEQPWEGQGLVPDPDWKEKVKGESWYLGNTYHISIGQGDLLVTPLQITNALAAIANKGTLYRPTLLRSESGDVIRSDLFSSEVAQWVRRGMEAACNSGGTAYPFFDFPQKVACKTGTAETGIGENTHAWFVVFAPSEQPEIILTVFLENGGEGSHDAAPVAREILDWYGSYRLGFDNE